MRVTFILKNLTDAFFVGNGGSIKGINNMEARECFDYLVKQTHAGSLGVTMQIGTSNQFRDRVELNQMLRGPLTIAYSLAPRRGYRLATFELVKA